jgi:hypothetical protein
MSATQDNDFITPPAPPPAITIPTGASVAVSIIDTGTNIQAPMSTFLTPSYPGHDSLDVPAYSFLVEHASGRKVLFDLGVRQDWQNLSPVIVARLKEPAGRSTLSIRSPTTCKRGAWMSQVGLSRASSGRIGISITRAIRPLSLVR